ncbi:ABC transporter permease [Leptolyngbya sp. FACHB-711]|uniref:ABC transporter permease n=1 Tax=unclassified Leptolyngbya TaxID=2650499 RepID=UPI0016856B71|nr:ABC transporter permease [Leptolyngbya sp. FACHB-711]MBD1851081.1 ABC transporter permease [Cyanobacteria bacterium FACHB-502]MBD2025061.1 ABC transporter permease [Leptolyngbya sp. FACHB-711]
MSTTTPPVPSALPEKPSQASWRRRFSKLVQPLVLLAPPGLWLLVLLVLPTLLILELSLIPGFRLGQPAGGYGIGNYLEILLPRSSATEAIGNPYLRVIGRSLYFATGSTLLTLVLGFPVAYWIAVMAPARWRNLLLVGFVLPLWTSSLLRAYAWITILRPTGLLNSILGAIGIPGQDWLNQSPAVFIGMAYSFLPYMVLILYASLEKLDKRLLEAASDLGATPSQAFLRITVPQTLPGIAAGGLLVFIASLGDFVVPELLGGASNMTISRFIFNQFLGATRNWGLGSSLSMILIFAVSVSIALLIKYGDRDAV